MNILYNISHLNRSYGGIFQYSTALLNILGSNLKEHCFYVFYLEDDEYILDIINSYDNLILVADREPVLHKIQRYSQSVYNLAAGRISGMNTVAPRSYFRHLLKKYKIDIIHSPHQELMKDHQIGTPSITTLHDVQELHFPEYFSAGERAERAASRAAAIEHADHIIVSYDHIKKDIIKYFSRSDDDVDVVLLNMGKLWLDNFSNADVMQSVKGVPMDEGPFLFYPAATWPHKNHAALIRALKSIRDINGKTLKLIFTGHQSDFYRELINEVNELGLQEQVSFLGLVSEQELYTLYRKAALVVVPTMYEAGSFPLMEALILHTPVISSNVTSLPETMGNADYVFDPKDHEALGQLIVRMLEDEAFKQANIENSYPAADALYSDKCVAVLKDVYRKISE